MCKGWNIECNIKVPSTNQNAEKSKNFHLELAETNNPAGSSIPETAKMNVWNCVRRLKCLFAGAGSVKLIAFTVVGSCSF